jgi:hypothetical protein
LLHEIVEAREQLDQLCVECGEERGEQDGEQGARGRGRTGGYAGGGRARGKGGVLLHGADYI